MATTTVIPPPTAWHAFTNTTWKHIGPRPATAANPSQESTWSEGTLSWKLRRMLHHSRLLREVRMLIAIPLLGLARPFRQTQLLPQLRPSTRGARTPLTITSRIADSFRTSHPQIWSRAMLLPVTRPCIRTARNSASVKSKLSRRIDGRIENDKEYRNLL